jgi:hypothetical protein
MPGDIGERINLAIGWGSWILLGDKEPRRALIDPDEDKAYKGVI